MEEPTTPKTPLPPPMFRNGQLIYAATGLTMRSWMSDLYHLCIRAPWGVLIFSLWIGYLAINVGFALAYIAMGNEISGAEPGSFWDAFWFSVQTLSTIGYGSMSPTGWLTNAVATVESFIGIVIVAMGTGMMFAKFSRPTARVAFSNNVIVHHRDGVPCLMFRMANERASQIVEAQLRVSVIKDEQTREGHVLRRFYPLKLERQSSPIFALTWTAIHPMDERSPLHGMTAESIGHTLAGVVITFTGIDDTFAQSVHARHTYLPDDVIFNHRFVDMLDRDEAGMMTIHHGRLSLTEPLPRDDIAEALFGPKLR